jgi:hypothetical protein
MLAVVIRLPILLLITVLLVLGDTAKPVLLAHIQFNERSTFSTSQMATLSGSWRNLPVTRSSVP